MTEQESKKKRFGVIPRPRRAEITAETFSVPCLGAQSTLFPTPRPGLLIFVFFPEVTEDEFRKTLENAKPSVIVELRKTPRFDIGNLSRQVVFQYFDREHSKYLDLTSRSMGRQDGMDLAEQIKEVFSERRIQFDKPIMFLLSTHNSPPELSQRIVRVVAEIKKTPPEVLEVPHFAQLG